ncbi:uncharacterized protein [Chelonus insularis]|uniref:uncharacterized protein n=1 Tax=Chelonus insularis TaxID=460826 RepID=UPI00158F2222|nr:uncharacterized protein LOC118065634 [Chelonus insularis]
MRQLQSRDYKLERKKKKKKKMPKSEPILHSSSLESDISPASPSRPDSGSFINTPMTRLSPGESSKSSSSRKSHASTGRSETSMIKKKNERGPLRVSINETAELIEDHDDIEDRYMSSHCDDHNAANPCNNDNAQNYDSDACDENK